MCEPMEKKNPVGSIDKEDLAKGLALSLQKNASCGHPLGSYAKGKGHEKSDIDIGFLLDGPADIVNLTNTLNRLLQNNNVDIVDLGRASPLLRYAAATNGAIFYEREPGLFTRFFSLSCLMSVDTKELRDARDRRIEQFLKARGSA